MSEESIIWSTFLVGVLVILGALIGSFLNVVVYRVPAGRSIVAPPSACPHCGARIRPWDNIPVLSWIVLRARCRDCGAPISWRYPLVELVTAVIFAAIGIWRLASLTDALVSGETTLVVASVLELVAYLYLAAISVALVLIDLDAHRLPDVIVLPGYAVGAVLLVAVALLRGDLAPLLSAGIGAAALFAFYFVLSLISPRGMGGGDVKLAGVIGLFLGWFGWGALLVGAFSAFVFGGVFSLLLVLFAGARGKTGIPFGPWMLLGGWVGIIFGNQLAAAYLSSFGLN